MASLFTKIVRGEIPCHLIMEDEQHMAFLDVRPVKTGHTLVIPKEEVDYIFDLSEEQLAALTAFAKKVATRLKERIECKRIGIMVAGLEVPHTHIHLIPMERIADLSFANARDVSREELEDIHRRITA